jgi:S-methylmethionine-dependent homocysteine/selenocysteine methylase/SAM-dependent methyltransferase
MGSQGPATTAGAAYGGVRTALAQQRCVILDGGVATELEHAYGQEDERLWGIEALASSPDDVLDVHRRYVAAGVDVLSTNTWGLATALSGVAPVEWMEIARRGVRLARQAIAEGGRDGQCAVAFSLNADLDQAGGEETVALLARAFADDPPDLILAETLSLVRPSLFAVVERLLETGLPLWLSFRRCRHGLCGVYGQHWGGPEGDAFGRAARRFEELGVEALLVNCIPPDHVDGMVGYLRDFTDLPLGVYPNLGYHTNAGWRFETEVGGPEFAAMALRWREEGAQIVGGCCGTGPEHIAAARERLAGTTPGSGRATAAADPLAPHHDPALTGPWTDTHGRRLYPLELPDLVAGEDVPAPGPGAFVLWRHLFAERVGAGRRCLDVSCGVGLQTVQLARNGAAHVHGIDADAEAVAATMTNAFRNGVAEQVTAAATDLFAWVPEERYDVIVGALDQTPVDPFANPGSHRPLDYWGRNAVDHLIGVLPEALTDDGVAYLLLLSILSQGRTAEVLAAHGLRGTVADYAVVEFPEAAREQVARVESLSDAHHLRAAGADMLVAYVLEVRR